MILENLGGDPGVVDESLFVAGGNGRHKSADIAHVSLPRWLDREACTTAAGGGRIGIVDLEGSADQLVDIIDFGPVQEG